MRHLIALHETGSFSRAAELLHITQPALSRSIQTLEEELGLPLIDRIGKRNEFTAFGEAVIARAKRIAFETEELKRTAQLLRGGQSGSIRLGMGAGPSAMLTHRLVKRLTLDYPMIQIDLSQGTPQTLLQQLHNKSLDALVIDTRVTAPSDEFIVEQLPDMGAGFLCRSGHPLLSFPRVGIQDLLQFRVASSRLSAEIGRLLQERYGPPGNPDQLVTLFCDSLSALLETTAHTDAVYLGIFAPAIEHLVRGELVELPLTPALDSSARFGIYTLAGRTQPPALDILRAIILDEIQHIQTQLQALPCRHPLHEKD